MNDKTDFNWNKYPEAWQWMFSRLEIFSQSNRDIAILAKALRETAGARLIDFVDHLVVEDTGELPGLLENYGYSLSGEVWTHQGAILPRVVLSGGSRKYSGIALKVDSIAQFLMVRGLELPINGSPYSKYRRCEISRSQEGVGLWVVERRGYDAVEAVNENAEYPDKYVKTLEKWQTRPREGKDLKTALVQLKELAQQQIKYAGQDLAADLFFEVERQYWQSRNRAARIQKSHLDMVGMGWANHDHHTFRSSRQNYSQVVQFFQILGFQPREQFYAGEEAGWGGQVMENPRIAVTLFLDVDLLPLELNIDFAHTELPAVEKLGAAGIWCALHGDSLFEAGMHHMAVRSDFEALTETLKKENINMMKPFSNFPYLRQVFSHGEPQRVNEDRIRELLNAKLITAETAENFSQKGAVGSHLENIQREDGYKGFSQKDISAIIKETDPRRYKLE